MFKLKELTRFSTLKELVEYIEDEANRRAEEILEKGEYDFDRIILNIIKNSSNSVSSIEIATLTGLPHHRVCKKLRKLSNFGVISCSTRKEVRFWRFKGTNQTSDTERPELPDARKGSDGSQSEGKGISNSKGGVG